MPMEGYTLASVNEFIGRELGVSDWITVDQERINQFADCTGDHQWIHVDVERAQRESPFGGTVAHGYLTLSLLPAMQYSVGTLPDGVKAALNYGADKVRFIQPVKAGARIRYRITRVGAEGKGNGRSTTTTRHTVAIADEAKPASAADTPALLMS